MPGIISLTMFDKNNELMESTQRDFMAKNPLKNIILVGYQMIINSFDGGRVPYNLLTMFYVYPR